ncbi:sigma-E factor negative regulatory protein RseA [Pseudidiomarina indica]|uniref:Anti-sigma-E factor RseA n=1 Tax=Pseudidiomarina indica TaxID=1159017 RepID=A0A1G6AD80_9GAMM|nr:RseA family anti-sigma factor [Pseudidiomarina indica]SDB06260.1 sigma-E factor negative regulatory protein RseA [Pseudidiomarina indica]
MSDCLKQNASALLDSHFEDTDADAGQPFNADLSALLDDEQARAVWQRYALVGQIMRREVSAAQSLDISAQVAAQIAQEPQVTAQVVTPLMQSGGALTRAASRWLKPAGSIAIAASVAIVAVLSVQQPGLEVMPNTPAVTTPTLVTNPFGGRNPVSFNTVMEAPAPTQAEIAQQRQLLQSYLLDHQRQLQLSLQAEMEQQEHANEVEPIDHPHD